jgi:hypothetical protein
MDLIKSLWRGDISLAKTFWLFGFCVNLLFSAGINYFIIMNKHALSTSAGFISLWVLIIFSLLYAPFIYISIWRSANKYRGLQRYAIAAKIMVIIGWSRYIMEVLSIFEGKSG